MIRLSGRMTSGLDEFMLRVGHLKVLAGVAVEVGGSRYRFERAAAELLTAPSTVPHAELPHLIEYLHRKRLCSIRPQLARTGDGESSGLDADDVRYPDLIVEKLQDGRLILTDGKKELTSASVWWQDRCLACSGIPSKVGAVTVSAKAGSKTGLSHVIDWAETVGLLSSTAQATPEGRLLARLDGKFREGAWIENPYVLGNDRILLSYSLLASDLDFFSRLMVALTATEWPLRKKSAASLFSVTLERLIDEAEAASYLTPRQRFHLTGQLRELRRAARKRQGDVAAASTTWHRAASRMETYVDLGVLTKETRGMESKFEYIYYPTSVLSSIVDSLSMETIPEDWLESRLVACLIGRETRNHPLTLEEFRDPLIRVLSVLRAPTTSYPLTPVALGLARLFADTSEPISIRAARNSLEELARSYPAVARLARGTVGQRAEYISVDVRKL